MKILCYSICMSCKSIEFKIFISFYLFTVAIFILDRANIHASPFGPGAEARHTKEQLSKSQIMAPLSVYIHYFMLKRFVAVKVWTYLLLRITYRISVHNCRQNLLVRDYYYVLIVRGHFKTNFVDCVAHADAAPLFCPRRGLTRYSLYVNIDEWS